MAGNTPGSLAAECRHDAGYELRAMRRAHEQVLERDGRRCRVRGCRRRRELEVVSLGRIDVVDVALLLTVCDLHASLIRKLKTAALRRDADDDVVVT